MSGCTHFAYAEQGTLVTFVPPTRAIPVISAGAGGSQREVIEGRLTGACRALFQRWLGAKPVSGSIVTHWWDEDIATLFKRFLTDTATTGSDPYEHGMIPNDAAALGFISGQLIHSTAQGVSLLAMVISSIEIGLPAKELVTLTFNYEAADKARSSTAANATQWDSLSTASPALVVPGTMYEDVARPLAFYDGTIETGGTLAYTNADNQIVVTSGSTLAKVISATITIDAALDTDGYEINNNPTRVEFAPGSRDISVSMEVSFEDLSSTLYDLANAGTATALVFDLKKTATLGAEIIIPSFFIDPFAMPDVTGDASKKTYTLNGKAQEAIITGGDGVETDINVIIYNGEASI